MNCKTTNCISTIFDENYKNSSFYSTFLEIKVCSHIEFCNKIEIDNFKKIII